MTTLVILVVLTAVFLVFSLVRSRERTGRALKQTVKMGKGMAGEIIAVLGIVALLLAYLSDERITFLLGAENGFLSSVYGAVIGAVTIIPGIIAFPLARELHHSGAVLGALAAFITTLTMVGIATSPLEKRHFGLKFTLIRNSLSFIFAVGIAGVMGALL